VIVEGTQRPNRLTRHVPYSVVCSVCYYSGESCGEILLKNGDRIADRILVRCQEKSFIFEFFEFLRFCRVFVNFPSYRG
jgi:hypothetical protein